MQTDTRQANFTLLEHNIPSLWELPIIKCPEGPSATAPRTLTLTGLSESFSRKGHSGNWTWVVRGGMVRSFLQEGVEAVGIEGSDHPRRLGLGEWGRCPYHLFTCDITEPFELQDHAGLEFKFDVVTAWEVLEHIPEDRLPGLIRNIVRHLHPGGYFIAFVDQTPDVDPLTGAVYHQTLQSKDWWLAQFARYGFVELRQHSFRTQDFVRGNAVGIKDWDPAAGDGFHLVLRLVSSHA